MLHKVERKQLVERLAKEICDLSKLEGESRKDLYLHAVKCLYEACDAGRLERVKPNDNH